MNKHILVLGVGLATGLSACSPKEPTIPTGNPPYEPPTENPPEPVDPPPAAVLPTWDDVKSTHPEGATNPPHPILIVTPDGAHCFKQYVGGMMMGPPDHVQECGPGECGTEIQCVQPKAQDLLAAYAATTPREPEDLPTRNPPAPK